MNAEAQIEIAAERVALERERRLADIVKLIGRDGVGDCIDCDTPIPEARRAAVRFAVRCIDCQTEHEGRKP